MFLQTPQLLWGLVILFLQLFLVFTNTVFKKIREAHNNHCEITQRRNTASVGPVAVAIKVQIAMV